MVGTLQKTPSPIVSEVLGLSTLDAVTLDTEHAPFGPVELDACIGALRAADMPSIVRVAEGSPTPLRNALDSGATGLLVPHVSTVAQARDIVAHTRFGEGGRGYAGSPRAAGYGTKSMADHLADSAAQTFVIVQIEDLAAVDQVADIAAVDGVDAVFVGRVDLAVAMGCAVSDTEVVRTVETICEVAKAAGTVVGMFTPDLSELPHWRELGATLFLLSSEHAFVLSGANQLAASIR